MTIPTALAQTLRDIRGLAADIDAVADRLDIEPELAEDAGVYLRHLTGHLRDTADQLTLHLDKLGLIRPPTGGH